MNSDITFEPSGGEGAGPRSGGEQNTTLGKAFKEGISAGHAAYEGTKSENPYPYISAEYDRWSDGWAWAFECAEANDV